jgi:uncharacterized membrane protein YjfL (UPF0719 family)
VLLQLNTGGKIMLSESAELASIVTVAGINITYAIICIVISIVAMVIGYKIFDVLTPFNTALALKSGNIAVAIFNGLVALGIGICSGLVIGMSCN